MPEIIIGNPFWSWLGLAAIFLAIEVLIVPMGLFLCLGTSAGVVALSFLIVPGLSWTGALLLFSGVMVVSSFFWWRLMQRRRSRTREADLLGSRRERLLGMRLVLDAPIVNGQGRVKLNDAAWPVKADTDYPAGARVEVVEVSGITLKVRAIAENPEGKNSGAAT